MVLWIYRVLVLMLTVAVASLFTLSCLAMSVLGNNAYFTTTAIGAGMATLLGTWASERAFKGWRFR